MKKFDLEDRLIDFADMVIEVVETLPKGKASIKTASQNQRHK